MNILNLQQKQKGFSILAVILVIVAVIVAIGVWSLSGQTNTSNASNSSSDILASSIANDGASIKLAFDTLVINGASPTSIVFIPPTTATTAPNMLDVVAGIQLPKPNAKTVRQGSTVPEGMWIYAPNTFSAKTIGSSSIDKLIVIAGVKDSVCQRINNTLYGSTTIPPSGITDVNALFSDVTAANPTTMASSFSLATSTTTADGWTSGCLSTGGIADKNLYFKVLQAN